MKVYYQELLADRTPAEGLTEKRVGYYRRDRAGTRKALVKMKMDSAESSIAYGQCPENR